jgi:hypothetical protein
MKALAKQIVDMDGVETYGCGAKKHKTNVIAAQSA